MHDVVWRLLYVHSFTLGKPKIVVGLTESYGSGGCGRNSNAGCCESCCGKSFDEDNFEAQVQKDLKKTRDPNAPPATSEQPQATEGMSAQSSPQAVGAKQEEK
ncbi:hypothetical protein CVT25_010380 [Psilocybe cyanescens]|uniref:Uncharacterized protein n=1 Tax=Psilocybe cyanescens TaxID=93625 RepID=A0A409XP95_PSICY|nr:hypothetical protein CVT25_010380 [Psilocybe cyanescens]